jgi:quinolinate synthase
MKSVDTSQTKIIKPDELIQEIQALKKTKNAVILAHYYQEEEIQDIADFIGDSLDLARKAQSSQADIIVFAGVHFMAEGAKILNPSRKVLVPDMRAGCSLSDSCPPDQFARYRALHPHHKVVTYINCSAAIKAQSDLIVTSSNAVKLVNQFPKDQALIFAPDRNLGAYVAKETGRSNILLWQGTCMVHETFSERKIIDLKLKYPEALIIAHPECEASLLAKADFIGSTSALLKFTESNPAKTFIVATEEGILYQMKKNSPTKNFIPAPPNQNCACNECPFMKLNTLEKIRNCLRDESNEILISDELRLSALKPLELMLELSK